MVRLAIALRTSARGSSQALEAFRYLMLRTRLEPGCAGCSAWTDPDGSVHYTEAWHTEDDMKRRVLSDHFVRLLAVLESTDSPPQVQFDVVTTTRGLDYVAETRHAASRRAEDR